MKLSTPHRSVVIALIVTCLLVISDGLFKFIALSRLRDVFIPVLPGVAEFYLHKNLGVVANTPIPLLLVIPLSVVILIGCSMWLSRIWSHQPSLAISLVLLIGGAFGNLVDRVVHGFTTDYLLLFSRSIINLSDVLIVLGILGILFATNKTSPHQS
ncbi:hypothetical protein COV06_03120 [Candidatus Uhrbacteria bacterium CG10_big_fil_rev_8_21_14_0_10_50_16]|uniref:Uncharacterized protein n=1 Tax=Candidatus Uhrbacteria bacterium CG10_big_fil_rev_8_21_14_0_10_50_16 TaxID=1975039 RepID=A0A2H0RN60_9BACT|nr:MAG: hypothetical protein COV06_03120 [Candidatus Uhrbacteria bacterium CG10_big_fil_rev_8_21_14_0_10_50_16]